jgi:hypothetical protein
MAAGKLAEGLDAAAQSSSEFPLVVSQKIAAMLGLRAGSLRCWLYSTTPAA